MKLLNEYPLSISASYVQTWGLWEAVRELIQNALDSDKGHSISYDECAETLTITSYGQRLDPSTLVLGGSSKQGDSKKIGKWGEGYKLAALVLVRDGYELSISNQELLWEFSDKYSPLFKSNILTVSEYDIGAINKDLEFTISGISSDEYLEIKQKCLQINFYNEVKEDGVKETSFGNILVNHGGSVYVNGLYVCDQDTKHSYDIKPEYIELDRDRRSVSYWDSGILFSKMWSEVGLEQEQVEELIAGASDYRNAEYRLDKDSKQKVIDSLLLEYGEAYFVGSQSEFTMAKEQGYENIIFLDELTKCIVMESGLYEPPEPDGGLMEILTPIEYVEGLIQTLKQEGYEALCSQSHILNLLEESSKWQRR